MAVDLSIKKHSKLTQYFRPSTENTEQGEEAKHTNKKGCLKLN